MNFTNQQKRYIRKNIKTKSLKDIAKDLDVSEEAIHSYLQNIYTPNAYQNLVSKSQSSANTEFFSFQTFFSRNKNIFVILTILVFVSYFNSLHNNFVSDDLGAIANNPQISSFKNVTVSWMGCLQRLFYFISYTFGRLDPAYFRIINIISHLAASFAIFILISILLNKRVALLTTSLFAVHPILTESVTWISGGLYSEYSIFFLISLLTYILSKNDNRIYYYSIIFFFTSILFSEKAMSLFLVFPIYEIVWGNLRKNWKKIIPYGAISLALALIYVGKIGQRLDALETTRYQKAGMDNPLVQVPVAIISYLKLIFWPSGLTLYHTEMSFSTGQYAFMLILFVLFVASIFYSWKKNKYIFFWLCFFIITLLPTLTPFRISWIVAERYVYLGSIGIFAVVAILIDNLINKKESYKTPVYILFSIIILALSVRTIVRNIDWKNEDNLWIATLKTSPSGPNIHNNMGDVYGRQGKPDKAIEEFKKAIEISPRYADAYHNLANTYAQIGKFDEAIENYNKAIQFNPNLWQSYQQLAAVYFSQGNNSLAEENIKKALNLNPGDESLEQNLKLIEEKNKL